MSLGNFTPKQPDSNRVSPLSPDREALKLPRPAEIYARKFAAVLFMRIVNSEIVITQIQFL